MSDRAQAERDFLLARMDGHWSWVGLSSDAMVRAALTTGVMPEPGEWPRDEHDLARCEKTLLRAPSHLQPIMEPWVERYRRHVAEGGLYCRGCDNSIGHRSTQEELCEACWAASRPGEDYFGRKPRATASAPTERAS